MLFMFYEEGSGETRLSFYENILGDKIGEMGVTTTCF